MTTKFASFKQFIVSVSNWYFLNILKAFIPSVKTTVYKSDNNEWKRNA